MANKIHSPVTVEEKNSSAKTAVSVDPTGPKTALKAPVLPVFLIQNKKFFLGGGRKRENSKYCLV